MRRSGIAPAASLALVLAACTAKPTPEASAPPAVAALAPAVTSGEAGRATSQTRRPGCVQQLAAFDTDGDRRVSLAEFQARPHPHPDPATVFQSRDRDTDGFLTETEFCAGWGGPDGPGMGPGAGSGMGPGAGSGMGPGAGSGMGPGAGSGMGPGAGSGMGPGAGSGMGPGAGSGMGPGAGSGMHCEDHFKGFDVNADGNITEQEFTALPHAHADPRSVFSERDQNHDGQISKEEFCAPWSPPPKP